VNRLLLLAALAACKPRHTCEQPDAPVQLQLLADADRDLNPDEDGAPWATNLRVYELKAGAELDRLDFDAVYRDGEKAFGEAFLAVHEFVAFPARRARWTLALKPETAHVVTVGLFRRPIGDAWYQVYDVPQRHAARRCEAEARGESLPDPCVYLALERSELDGGSFPPAGFDVQAFTTACAPVVAAAPAPPPRRRPRKPKLPSLPTLPRVPELPNTPSVPELPQAPAAPQTPPAPAAPQAPSRPRHR
jgi:type VI secretion system VasD/TssJ family lipoprotein